MARDFGVPTHWVKVQALVISSIFPGAMGAFYTWYINYIETAQVFGLKIALIPVARAMLGGSGLVIGPVVGTVVLYMAEEWIWTQFEHLHGAMLGLVIVIVGLFMPGGLMRLGPMERFLDMIGLREADR